MKPIWSHFVTGTPSPEPERGAFGIPLTDPNYERILLAWRNGLVPILANHVRARNPSAIFTVKGAPNFRVVAVRYSTSFTRRLWSAFNKTIHVFGFHTMIEHIEWNPDTGEVLEVGFSCTLCTYEEQE